MSNIYTMDEYKRILIDILDEVVDVCKKNNFKYYLGYGTVLGAVRHKGFIPWDDDIDVIMPRKDYDFLIQNGDNLFKGKYQLSFYGKTPKYYYDFVKIERTDTTLIERIDPLYVGGLYVDIFPLDNVPSIQEDEKMITPVKKFFFKDYQKFCVMPLKRNFFIKWILPRIGRMLCPINTKLAECDAIASQYRNEKTAYIRDFHTTYVDRGLFKADVFGDGVEMLFEGKMYMIPTKYDAYLRQYYGDYMTPPPLGKRNSGHNFLYVNIYKRLNKEELKPIVKKLKDEYTYQFNFRREWRMVVAKIKEWCEKSKK